MKDSYSLEKELGIQFDNAICYSGYRQGQSPLDKKYPSYAEVFEDLKILQHNWKYLRIYDASHHADLVLEVIRNEALDFKVLLGSDLLSERNSSESKEKKFTQSQLDANQNSNNAQVLRMIELANEYSEIVFAASIANETTIDWSVNQVSVGRLVDIAKQVKKSIKQPITFCENYIGWPNKLEALAQELDFVSMHIYPVWEYKSIHEALDYTKQNYELIRESYPDKLIVITEAGWATKSNNSGIEASNASPELQAQYYDELIDWARSNEILTFVFEAFDEPWKGSADQDEPEKHWGLFDVNRKPKQVMQTLYSHLT